MITADALAAAADRARDHMESAARDVAEVAAWIASAREAHGALVALALQAIFERDEALSELADLETMRGGALASILDTE